MIHRTPKPEMLRVRARVHQRRQDYISYDFSRKKNDILKTFFDLSQEFESLRDLYRICVAVPREFMGLESRLYLVDEADQQLKLVCDSRHDVPAAAVPLPAHVRLSGVAYEENGSFLVPINRRQFRDREFAVLNLVSPLFGMFEIFPAAKLSEADRFFFTKYTNRIGYNIYNRILDRQHIRHLKFINTLVLDIEHNIIVPNMYFRYLFRQLRKQIEEMGDLQRTVDELVARREKEPARCGEVGRTIAVLRQRLDQYLQEVEKHHGHLSLFLESLFRRDHFEKGHLVLRSRSCFVEKEIILPPIDHFRKRLEARDIQIERPPDMGREEIPLVVDVGLLSQVYANLFSNAVKYTEAVATSDGRQRKALAYGYEFLADYFGNGKDGVRFNVFTTGRHIPEEERASLYASGFRCRRDEGLPGSGHGLAFIRNVVEIHSGEVGYEATGQGNNFYFVLPLPPRDVPRQEGP